MTLAAQLNPWVVLVFGFAMLTTALAFRSLRRARQPTAASAAGPATATAAQYALQPDAYRHWEVELHELGRELQARIDNKAAILEMLIQQAAAESQRLERLLREAEQARASER